MAQVGWVIDYLPDLDADFLRFYGIDIGADALDGPRFLNLAQRVSAYGGVMAARAEEQRETAPAVRSEAPAQAPQDRQHMELAAMRLAHPGLISVTRVTPQEEVE